MTADLEEHVRRSLARGVRDVEPDPATWDAVQARIRRRAVTRRAAVGLATAAVLLVAAFVVPGLVTETRIDLSPADPGDPGTGSLGAPGLVHTDGRQIVFTDGTDEVVVAAIAGSAPGQSIRRLAVRPGSTPDALTVAYLVAGPDCDRAEMRWVTVDRAGTRGGFLEEGGSSCLTDPVWSPDGAVAAWVRRQPPSADSFEPAPAAAGDVHLLALQGWHDDDSQGGQFTPSSMAAQSTHLDLSSLEEGVAPVRALRATGWVWSQEGGTLHLSAAHEDRSVQAGRISAIPRPGNPGDVIDVPTQPQPTDDHDGPSEYPSALVEPVGAQGDVRALVTVGDPHADGGLAGRTYSLALGTTGGLEVQRDAGGDSWTLEVPDHVLGADQADGAWLSAWGDTVVLGAGGDAWVVYWRGAGWGEPEALPGVVHADVLERS